MFAGPLGRSTFTPPKSSFDSPLYGLVSLRRSHIGLGVVLVVDLALHGDLILDFGWMLAGGLFFNLVPDYVSLLETRFVLSRMRRTGRLGQLAWLVVDIAATTLIFFLAFFLIVLPLDGSDLGDIFSTEVLRAFWLILTPMLTLSREGYYFAPGMFGPFLWTTYFTSVWLLLYQLSGVLLRVVRGAVFVRRHLNINEKPLSSMGFLAGGLVTCGWWTTCLVSWVTPEG